MDKVIVFIPANLSIPTWQRDVVEVLKRYYLVDYCSVERDKSESKLRSFLKLKDKIPRIFYAIQLLTESKLFRINFGEVKLENSKVLKCYPKGTRYVDIVEVSDCQFAASDYVFGLNFGFRIVRGGILGMFKGGLLGFHHGDPDNYRGSAPGFFEIHNGEPFVGLIIQRLSEELDGGEVLAKSFVPCHYSLGLTQNWLFEKSSVLMTEFLSGATYKEQSPMTQSFHRVYKFPKFVFILIYILKFWIRLIKSFFKRKMEKYVPGRDWSIGYLTGGRLRTVLMSNRDYYYADPFSLPDGSLVCERFNRKLNVGEIIRVNNGKIIELLTDKDCHKSYPYYIKYKGFNYIIPETGVSKEIFLLKEIDGNYILIDSLETPQEIFDFSVFSDAEDYYGFYTVGNRGADSLYSVKIESIDPLKIDFSDSTLITTDERFTRCGGRVWVEEESVYRIIQQQRFGNYGESIGIAVHDRYDLRSFDYVPLLNINQNFGLLNLHTLDVFTGLIDYKKK